MASQEHLILSQRVKDVHLRLRTRAQEIGPEAAWEEHLKETKTLENYASDMKLLAEEHWAKINQGVRKSQCRIEWVINTIHDYFFNGGLGHELKKECDKLQIELQPELPFQSEKLKVLDVGSCYNPFRICDSFKVYPIDLSPAVPDVLKCNFLGVDVTENPSPEWFSDPVVSIPSEYYDAVVFCLFLEYLPCSEHRLRACELAWKCLRPQGTLLIVTPDSNHQTAHSALMKEWNLALIRVGFVRFKLEKLRYLYCMAFRKTAASNVKKYLDMKRYQCDNMPKITTPQDSVNYVGDCAIDD